MTSREKERKNTKVYRTEGRGSVLRRLYRGRSGNFGLLSFRPQHHNKRRRDGGGPGWDGDGESFFLFPRQKIGRAFGVQTNFRDWVWFLLLTFSCFFVSLATNGGVGSIYIQGARGWNWYKQTLGYYFCVAITSLCLLSILFVSSSLFRNLMYLRVHLPPLFLLSSP